MPQPEGCAPLCPEVIEAKTTIEDHERRIKEGEMERKEFREMFSEIRDRLLARPSWFVSIIITALAMGLVGLLVYVLTGQVMG